MVARSVWTVIGGSLGVAGVVGAFGAVAGEPRDPVALDAVEISVTQHAQPAAAAPATSPTQTATTAPPPSGSETPSPEGTEEVDDDSSGPGSGPTVVSPPSPLTADTAD